MSRHPAVKILSGYLDRELPERRLRLVESHLETCADCRRRLDGLQGVAEALKGIDRIAPPATLVRGVQRRIELASRERRRPRWLELASGRWLAQPVLTPLLAVILALAAILYLFALAVDRGPPTRTRMVVASTPVAEPRAPLVAADGAGLNLMALAARVAAEDFVLTDDGLAAPAAGSGAADSVWALEPEVESEVESETGGAGAVAGRELRRVRLLEDGRVLDVTYAAAPGAGPSAGSGGSAR